MQPCYLEGVSCITQPETRWLSKFQQVRAAKLFFDGDESKYKLWEMKFFRYLRIQHLHQIVLLPTDQSNDIDFVEKNTTVFAELIQYLDDKNLSLVIKDAWDNGRKALTILTKSRLNAALLLRRSILSFN